jgi:hypothetical protein
VTQATLTRIVRQQIDELRAAVTDLSKGRTEAGFDKLDNFGAVHEHEDKAKRLAAIADLHLAARARGESSLIVAPTHSECRAIADVVREHQKAGGLIGQEDYTLTRLAKLNLTTAQRSDPVNYQLGQVVQFDKRTKGFKVSEQWTVSYIGFAGLAVTRAGQERILPLKEASAFNVYTREQMPLAPGDSVRVTKNFGPFRNNELCVIKQIDDGKITTTDGRTLSATGALHFDQGIAVTSHAAQGKTVDNVTVSAPVEAFAQVNEAQFYVSMSRARRSMHLFTDGKVALREAVTRSSLRQSVLSLIAEAVRYSRSDGGSATAHGRLAEF